MIETCCLRCSKLCRGENSSSPTARPFRHALKGYCTACSVCRFFQDDEGVGFAAGPDFDPQGLRLPHIQAQFARLLETGLSELLIGEVDWNEVIEKWTLPFPKRAQGKRTRRLRGNEGEG